MSTRPRNQTSKKLHYNISANWQVEPDHTIEPIHSFGSAVWRVSDSKRHYLLKRKADQAKAEHEHNLVIFLKSAGLPVSAPIPDKTGHLVTECSGHFYSLYEWLQGSVVKDHYSRPGLGQMYGSAIAELHRALARYKAHQTIGSMQFRSDLDGWITARIEEHKGEFQHAHLMKTLESMKDGIYALDALPQQHIHRDIHPSNMMFEGNDLTGLLDFEISMKGPRIFDVCYCSTSILVGGFGDETKRRLWPQVFSDVLKGYNTKLPLSQDEIHGLESVLHMIELIFLAFSCSVKSFDAARCNERVLYWLVENGEAVHDAIAEATS